jgi:Terpene cyclase DEP1
MKPLLIACCIAGAAIPYAFALPFFLAHGANPRLFLAECFANPISTFFAADLILSSLIFLSWCRRESQSRKIRGWWQVLAANLLVGLSLALPLYLLKSLNSAARSSSPAQGSGSVSV